jgi:uncharacterized protein (TIGR02996 family)
MADLESLYAGICAHPDEDTPRLVLADWLDEQGDKPSAFRADLIRTHCRLARMEPWSPEWRELNDHWGKKLSAKFESQKAENKLPWAAHLKGRVRAWALERGLVGHLTLFAKRFVNEGESYFEQDPVRSVKFVKLDSAMGSVKPDVLFRCEHLARVADVDFDGSGLADKALDQLGASPHVSGLRSLGLGGNNNFTRTALPKLLAKLPVLTKLSVADNERFANGHAQELAKCAHLARLRVLNLSGTGVKAEGVAALVGSKYAANLTDLGLQPQDEYDEEHGYALGPRGERANGLALCEALAATKHLAHLTDLNLNYCNIGGEGAVELAKAHLPALKRLHLCENAITRDGLKALVAAPLAKQLLFVNLAGNPNLGKVAANLQAMFPSAHIFEPVSYE